MADDDLIDEDGAISEDDWAADWHPSAAILLERKNVWKMLLTG